MATKPLFRLDPGWLFILAGLAICAAGIILPAQGDFEALQRQLGKLLNEETQAYARLKAHADFLDEVDRADPSLVKRLAATQLNLVPEGDIPILLANTDSSPVTNWIDATVHRDIRPAKVAPLSSLSKMANGPYRLWVFGGGIMSVFIGLLLSPGPARVRRASPMEVLASAAMLAAPPDSDAELESGNGAETLVEDLEIAAQAAEIGEFVPDVIELPVTLVETKLDPDAEAETERKPSNCEHQAMLEVAEKTGIGATLPSIQQNSGSPALCEPEMISREPSGAGIDADEVSERLCQADGTVGHADEDVAGETVESPPDSSHGSSSVLKFASDNEEDGVEIIDEEDAADGDAIDTCADESGYELEEGEEEGRRPPFDEMFGR